MTGAVLPFFVAVPLAAAALAVVLPPRLARAVLVATPLLGTAGAVALLVEHATNPVLVHQVGAFVPGIAIPLVSDTLSAVMLTVTGLTSAVCVAYAVLGGDARLRFFPSLALMLTAGVNGALLTGDLFNLFVFVEVMLLPSYALIAMTGTWRRLGIGRLFVVVNLLTSTIFLVGVGLVYGVAGSVNMAVLADADHDDPRFVLAVAVVLLALTVKAGVVPMHGWLPRAYPATSGTVMALFSALHTKVAIYAIYRIHSVVLDGAPDWTLLALGLALLTMLVGSYGSLGEKVIRRSLSWQMVAGVGYILLGLAIGSRLGLAAGLFYMVHHILVMGSLLLAAAAIEQVYRSGQFVRISGLMRREPLLATGTALALLSLVGFPPSSGFFGKVGLVRAAADLDTPERVVVLAVVVVASIGALVAMLRLWREVFWGPSLEEMPSRGSTDTDPIDVPPGTRAPRRLVLPSTVLLVASLGLFLVPGPAWDLAVDAADGLLDVSRYAAEVTGR
ncbi:monovalent cation/H+ antiporter subunit D family protein [Nocardioides deserti]|uniref:Monovalent cation/H+ antiporter subunit D family protein n=1 Tax=Nocardioides deserti TaxID=1588644 RepID=A0ABR6UD39_9ACTN|nr:monovalent cation/H+ antiporter subunit D family protein [Nocardioides deserti]MBC2962352.1 monovalent cation/H+ antiporter subunit D family protein [Nocardioides deserti]GGO72870.1 cation:proton antiporter [Nocardioides deserti]